MLIISISTFIRPIYKISSLFQNQKCFFQIYIFYVFISISNIIFPFKIPVTRFKSFQNLFICISKKISHYNCFGFLKLGKVSLNSFFKIRSLHISNRLFSRFRSFFDLILIAHCLFAPCPYPAPLTLSYTRYPIITLP